MEIIFSKRSSKHMEKHFWDKLLVFFLHSSFHWTNMCFNKISFGDNLGCICYLLLKPRYKKTLTCYTQLCLFSHFHWTRYFEGVPMCFATVLLYGSYYMRGIQFILFFPEGSQITSFVRIKLLRKGVLLLNTTHAKQNHSRF